MKFWWLVLALISLSSAWGQTDPATLARQEIEAWQRGEFTIDPTHISPTREGLIEYLEHSGQFAIPPPRLEVDTDQPRVVSGANPEQTVVIFPAQAGDDKGSVYVVLERDQPIRIQWQAEGGALPGFLASPVLPWFFLAFSLLFIGGLFRWPLLKQGWHSALNLIRQNWQIYLGINVVLYGLFVAGQAAGAADPELARALSTYVGSALEQTGVTQGLGNTWQLATFIFYWNFTRGLLLTTFVPALLLGFPAAIFNAMRLLVLGIPLSPALTPLGDFIFHVPTLVIELQAYILVSFGGLVLLSRLIRGQGYRSGLVALALTLIPAGLCLVVGAWYEAFEVSYFI
jgi:hypothetical protein